MRRTLSTILLSALAGLAVAACGSSTDSSSPSTTAKAQTSTTVSIPIVMGPKCQASNAMLQAIIAVNTPPVETEKETKALDNAATKLKEINPPLAANLTPEAMVYLHKLANGETTTAAEKESGNKAKDAINLSYNVQCKNPAKPTPPVAGGPTTTTAKK